MTSSAIRDDRAAVADRDPDRWTAARERAQVRRWTGALLVLCGAVLLLLFAHIGSTLPYPQHTDEGFISGPASNVLVKGELHPQRFNYPSLPTYIAASAMALGFLRSATHLEIRDITQLGQVGYPYYQTPRAVGTARQAFALLAVICVGMTGACAWIVLRRPSAILLAPAILLVSPLFFRHAWVYLNVDIVGASFVMLAVGACLLGTRRPSLHQSALVPGALAGLAAGSKYTLAIAILPVLLGIALYFPRGRRISAMFAAAASMIAGFLLAVPYSLIDIPGFLNGIGYETFHYASGHAGFAGDPGLPQLLYYLRHFVSEYGYGVAALAAVGLVGLPFADWRRAAVFLAFPLGLMWLLCSQRVHFTRNALAIQPFIATLAAGGVFLAHAWVVGLATRRGWTIRRLGVPAVAGVLLVIAAVPFWRFADHLRDRTDSRNEARDWIAANLPYNWAIVLPSELGFDRRGLDVRGRYIKVVDLRSARDPGTLGAALDDVPSPAVIIVPRWGADRRSPGQSLADALNELSRGWRVIQTFGTNDVLVNYSSTTAWGDPAFSIAILR